MRKKILCRLFVIMSLLSAVSCGRAKVIPRDELSEIYAEILILDQWINSDYKVRRMADTTLVYEPVFEKFGYTSDDYRKSVEHYMQDPDRYARILRKTTVILEEKIRELKKEKDILREISEKNALTETFAPERIFYLCGMANRDLLEADSLRFYIDSTGGEFMFDVQKGYDTLYYGPVVKILSDTLQVSAADSTAAEQTGGISDVSSDIARERIPVSSNVVSSSRLHLKSRPGSIKKQSLR